jgi:glucose/arabinose dehydrogenase
MRVSCGGIVFAAFVGLLIGSTKSPLQAQSLSSVLVPSTGLASPLYATYAPGASQQNNLFVVEKTGAIKVVNLSSGVGATSTLINIASTGANFLQDPATEQGLLGLAFHPNFQTNGYFYVHYNYGTGNGNVRVERYQMNPLTNAIVPAGQQTVIQYPHTVGTNHNGGWMQFSPRDNFLYVASGDGGSGNDPNNNGQNTNALAGKMLRLDVNSDAFPGNDAINIAKNYAIPSTNPFAASGGAPEVWAYGLRNPWRNSFDRVTGDLWIADVGQSTREEINFQPDTSPGGVDYGWRLREGKIANPAGGIGGVDANATDPIYDYPRTDGGSITGGYVYRGGDLLAGGKNLDGTYIYGDYTSGNLWSFRYDETTNLITEFTNRSAELKAGTSIGAFDIVSFGEDAFGRMYIVDFDGQLYRITGSTIPEPGTIAMVSIAGLLFYWKRARNNMLAAQKQCR